MERVDPSKLAAAVEGGEEAGRRIQRLERALARERAARKKAEALAEHGMRDLYVSQRRIGLLQRIAAKANEADTVGDALVFAVAEICALTGWAFGNVYLVSPENRELLVPSGIWHGADREGLRPFIEDSLVRPFRIGEGLPGRVLRDQRPHWLIDLHRAANFPRRKLAAQCGLRSAFAFPVRVGADIAAVIEFYAHAHIREDSDFLALMAQVGTQLGRVIERERFSEKLLYDALHDPLTGLPNRALFSDRATHALERRSRHKSHRVALMFLDLDGFKFVNDSMGHHAGDALLVEVAARLNAALAAAAAQAEAAGQRWPHWTVARLAGDEFTVLLEDFARRVCVVRLAETLLAEMARPHLIEGTEFQIGASIGIAFANGDAPALGDLLREADAAMYEAKTLGRGQVVVFDQALRCKTRARLETESDLRGAVQRQEFALYYQPIIDLASNRLHGFEALLRWRRRPDEIVAPGQFLPIAEETGLIVMIGNWVLREACEAAARWHRSFPAREPLTVSINVSPRQLMQPRFAAQVARVIAETGVAASAITLEITEGTPITDPERALAVMQEIRALGVRISLDDFGAAYSPLSELHRYPFNTLKLDRKFVEGLGREARSDGIVRAVLDLASSIDMSVVAEGIENNRQRDRLREMGCDMAQGFLYSQPVNADAAERLIERYC